jgi:S-DNA-T family DNA segregation ATPase FtsK/SpoIIIE
VRAMFEERNLKLDLFALALLALVVFLALALFTYHPGDTVGDVSFPFNQLPLDDQLVYPPTTETANACGRSGAVVAALLFNLFGVGAYYLLVSLAVLDVLLLTRRQINTPSVRLIGWMVSLVGLTSVAALVVPWLSPGPVIGSGGYLGAMGQTVLRSYFYVGGGTILALALIAGGLLLCTDYALIRTSVFVCTVTGQVLLGGGRLASRRLSRREKEEAEAEEEPDGSVPIRIRGRRTDISAEEEVEEESNEECEAEEESEELDEAAEDEDGQEEGGKKSLLKSVKERLTPKLRVRRVSDGKKRKKIKKKDERDEVIDQLDKAVQSNDTADYELPSLDLLLESDEFSYDQQEKEVRRKAKVLEKTFADFGFSIKVVEIETGPVIAQYEVELEAGLRLSRITGLADDLAIALRVPSVRIVAPIPGKNTVGIEVPNNERQIVRLREVMEEMNGRIKKMRIPLFLGKDVSGNPLAVDLSTLPHLLIAGRTGTGKSVCLNAIIASILMTRRPDEVRMLMIDPKMVELSCYKSLPHLMHPVVTDMRKAEAILAWAVEKMEERYQLLARAGVRHLSVYNQLGEEELIKRVQPETEEERKALPLHLPYIVIVADEMADLMMTSGKEVEQHIIRLAQKSRAVGIHLILATQKPTVDVITGLIKSNLPARIAFQVASRTDSRVVLDEMGADKLLGNGDMLFLWPGTSSLVRGQGTYLSDDEIDSVVDVVSTGEQCFVKELVHIKVEEDQEEGQPETLKRRDDLYEEAVDVVIREGRGSVSLLQRALGIGYGRAARLVDFMAEDGIVGAYAGSQAREVLITIADWQRMQGGGGDDVEAELEPEPEPKRKKRRSNKIIPVPDDEDEEPVVRRRTAPTVVFEKDEEEEDEYEAEEEAGEEEEEYEEYEEEKAADGEEEYEYEEEESDEEGEEYDEEEYEYEESA